MFGRRRQNPDRVYAVMRELVSDLPSGLPKTELVNTAQLDDVVLVRTTGHPSCPHLAAALAELRDHPSVKQGWMRVRAYALPTLT